MKYNLQKIDKESALFILNSDIQNADVEVIIKIDGELYTLTENKQNDNHYFEVNMNIKEYIKHT